MLFSITSSTSPGLLWGSRHLRARGTLPCVDNSVLVASDDSVWLTCSKGKTPAVGFCCSKRSGWSGCSDGSQMSNGFFCIFGWTTDDGLTKVVKGFTCGTCAKLTSVGRGCSLRHMWSLWTTGRNLGRNFLFRRLTRPEPSTLTMYWSNWRTSITIPILSHLVGFGPVWFCIRTLSPTSSGGRWWCVLQVVLKSVHGGYEGHLHGQPRFLANLWWLALTRVNGKEIPNCPAKNAHRGR